MTTLGVVAVVFVTMGFIGGFIYGYGCGAAETQARWRRSSR